MLNHQKKSAALKEAEKQYREGKKLAHSCFVLGTAYANGEEVEKDEELARKYMMEAAECPVTRENVEWVREAWNAILHNDFEDEPTFPVTWQEVLRYACRMYEEEVQADDSIRARSLNQIIRTFCDRLDEVPMDCETMAAYIRDAYSWPVEGHRELLMITVDSVLMDMKRFTEMDDQVLLGLEGKKPLARERAETILTLLERRAEPVSERGSAYDRERPPAPTKKKGCYIATAVYGSYDCAPVWTLRRFRDEYLERRLWGRALIWGYYRVSPWLVRRFGKSSMVLRVWRRALDALCRRLKQRGYDDRPYRD